VEAEEAEKLAAKYAARRRRLARVVKLPMLSGKLSAAVLIGCFLVTAALIPIVLRKDPWIDAEIVVVSWWVIWIIALSLCLYHGHKVSDDHEMKSPRSWGLKNMLSGWGWDVRDAAWIDLGGSGGEACAIGCLIIAALPLLVLLIWVMVEVAIPGILFIAYFLVRGQLAHVANDKHNCRGHVIRSIGWGTLWATVFTAPLAGLVWFVHFALSHHPA
jgi:hypothetical protein